MGQYLSVCRRVPSVGWDRWASLPAAEWDTIKLAEHRDFVGEFGHHGGVQVAVGWTRGDEGLSYFRPDLDRAIAWVRRQMTGDPRRRRELIAMLVRMQEDPDLFFEFS